LVLLQGNFGTGAGTCGFDSEWQVLAEDLITIVFFFFLFIFYFFLSLFSSWD
jgi:hypothetical protein